MTSLSSYAQVVRFNSFAGVNGANPHFVTLAQGRDGNLYGTTENGGTSGLGAIFKMKVSGAVSVLHNFTGPEGEFPVGGLTLATDGSFYGTASGGGTYGFGTLFKINASGVFAVLYSFPGGADGVYPISAPIEGNDENFYGLTFGDGQTTNATIYKFTATGVLSTIYTFDSSLSFSEGPLLQAEDGLLYATTFFGGLQGCGSLIKLTTGGLLKHTNRFSCSTGGFNPIGGVIQAADQNIYGTTSAGGTFASGTIFELGRNGQITFLYDFGTMAQDGSSPAAGVTQGTDGNFYGSTQCGGTAGAGSLFELTLGLTYSQLYSFSTSPGTACQNPSGALTQHTGGNFYGVTENGGADDLGSVYSLDVGLGPFVTFVLPFGHVGQSAQFLGQGFTGTTSVTFNGVPATSFKVVSDTYMTAVIPPGAATGPVLVVTPNGTLTSNKNFVSGH